MLLNDKTEYVRRPNVSSTARKGNCPELVRGTLPALWIPAYAGMTKRVVAVPPFDRLRANVLSYVETP